MNKTWNKIKNGFGSEDWKRQGEKFGLGVALATAILSALSLYRGLMERMEVLAMVSAILLACAFILPQALFPLAWTVETAFKTVTKTLMYILLFLMFFIVFSPVGIVLRILGKDPLERGLDPQASTYWADRKPSDPSRVEKQF